MVRFQRLIGPWISAPATRLAGLMDLTWRLSGSER